MNKPVALIVGAGTGISSAFAEALTAADYRVALAAVGRNDRRDTHPSRRFV